MGYSLLRIPFNHAMFCWLTALISYTIAKANTLSFGIFSQKDNLDNKQEEQTSCSSQKIVPVIQNSPVY